MAKTITFVITLACTGIITYLADNSHAAAVIRTLNVTKFGVYNIWSPNFPHNYPNNANCTWIVNSKKRFHVSVKVFELEACFDRLTISKTKGSQPLLGACSSVFWEFYHTYRALYITFTSDGSNQAKGFHIQIKQTSGANSSLLQSIKRDTVVSRAPCGGQFRVTGPLTIHSPNFPALYPAGANCTWFVFAPTGRSLIVNITDVNIEHSQTCQNDVLQVWTTKNVTNVAPTYRMCGNLTYMSSWRSQYLWIHFQSDLSVEFNGFQITIAVDGTHNCADGVEFFNAVARADILRVKRMLARGFDANCKDETGNAGLHIAVRKGHQNLMGVLLNKGAKVNILNAYGRTPLFEAIRLGSLSLATFLHRRGASISVSDTNSETCLHIISRWGYTSLLSFALANSIDINVSNTTGYTATHVAAENGHTLICKKLLEISTNVSRWTTSKGETPLLLASRNGHTSTVRLLITTGSPINKADNAGQTPLHSALKARKLTTAEYLLSKGADLGGTNDDGEMPLHVAARYGNGRIVNLLIRKGADVAATTPAGNAPLHEAVTSNKTDVMEVLINAGADITTANGQGESAFDLCDTDNHCQKVIVDSVSRYAKRSRSEADKYSAKVKFCRKIQPTTSTERTTRSTGVIETV